MPQFTRHTTTPSPRDTTRAVRRSRQARNRWAVLSIDVLVLAAALCMATVARYDGTPPDSALAALLWNLPFVVLLQYVLLLVWRVPRRAWSYLTLPDLPPIVLSLGVAGLLLAGIQMLQWTSPETGAFAQAFALQPGVIAIDTALAILGITGVRCLRRMQYQRQRTSRSHPGSGRARVLLIGAGWSGTMLLRELRTRADSGMLPVAFVDDDPDKQGKIVGGLEVVGTTATIDRIASSCRARTALIAIANGDAASIQRIVAHCERAGLQTKIIPPLRELASGRVRVSQVRDVAIEDLLGRKPVTIENSAAAAVVTDKVTVVTGAGGSIGSELARQILRLRPRRLVLVERTENSLYQIHRELAAYKGDVEVVQELADVTDAVRMEWIFRKHCPHNVLHAAAHKHVPMMELVPGEAIKNNFFGTKTVADLADRWRCQRFLLVSTDKAVNPSSVMGATKRLAELYIKDIDQRSDTRFTSVRFGNVMGSAGSVIPLFREQIAKGGPVTVTHPDMERYFMTIPEASRLVLEAVGIGTGGQVMVLDMGRPVRIQHLAEQMIRLSGLTPGRQIPIVYTGVRPGEKLQEELALPAELVEETRCEKLFVWRGGAPALSLGEWLSALRHPGTTPDDIRSTLSRVLPEYRQGESTEIAQTA